MAFQLISDFPSRLKEALNETPITDFAKKIGLSKQAISAYTLGTRKPKAPTISSMAVALNVSEAWLLGYDVSKKRDEFFISTNNILDYLKKTLTDEKTVSELLGIFLSEDEMDVLTGYKILDDRGKKAVIDTIEREKKYIKKVRLLNEQTDDEICVIPVAARSGEKANIVITESEFDETLKKLKPSKNTGL